MPLAPVDPLLPTFQNWIRLEQSGNSKHNAGIGDPSRSFASTDPETMARAFDVNVGAPMALTQALLPKLQRGSPARILLVGAGIADRPQPGTGIYGISKAVTARLMRQMATDFEHEGDANAPQCALHGGTQKCWA